SPWTVRQRRGRGRATIRKGVDGRRLVWWIDETATLDTLPNRRSPSPSPLAHRPRRLAEKGRQGLLIVETNRSGHGRQELLVKLANHP
ncbi:MAG: hypothetical protein AAF722_04940, partial [Cyanobacteria bacterium P01_C01_bin.70]